MSVPNKQQELVINHGDGPAAVMAGAGSGKTATLIHRIETLSKTVSPRRIVMLTFTNSAADEMKGRAIRVNPECQYMTACTYHKYCAMVLRRFGSYIGIPIDFEILSEHQLNTLVYYVKSKDDRYSDKDFPSASKLNAIYSKMINTGESIEEIICDTKYSLYVTLIEELYEEICEYKKANSKFSFDDLLIYMNELLDNEEACKKIASTFDYLMVDEFQDTNALQLSILTKLGQYNKNIVVVGDESQSIYKFRGANSDNIRLFINAFPGCKTYTLSLNYRSTQEILDAVNDIMHHSFDLDGFTEWDYTDMVANNKHGNRPVFKSLYSDFEMNDWVIEYIRKKQRMGVPLADIALIERTSMSSFRLETMLMKAHIPFEKRGGHKFTDYVCVEDILALLSVFTQTKCSTLTWFTVLKMLPGIGNKKATELSEDRTRDFSFLLDYSKYKFGIGLKNLYYEIVGSKPYVNNLAKILDRIIKYYLIVREDNIKYSKMNDDAKKDARDELERDKQVIDTLKEISSFYSTVTSFLDDLALDSLKTVSDDVTDKLIITTIHSAKGLEWPNVLLLDVGAYYDAIDNDMEEELRCLYVAMTRAENELYILFPRKKSLGYKTDNQYPSPFLSYSYLQREY